MGADLGVWRKLQTLVFRRRGQRGRLLSEGRKWRLNNRKSVALTYSFEHKTCTISHPLFFLLKLYLAIKFISRFTNALSTS